MTFTNFLQNQPNKNNQNTANDFNSYLKKQQQKEEL